LINIYPIKLSKTLFLEDVTLFITSIFFYLKIILYKNKIIERPFSVIGAIALPQGRKTNKHYTYSQYVKYNIQGDENLLE
jgi:hypothetical protein